MRLTVVNVAFPFAPVTRDPVGGAEQVLAHLDRALVAAGNQSIVVAAEGSDTAGRLVAIPHEAEPSSERARLRTYDAVRDALGQLLRKEAVDVVHLHGVDFHAYLPPAGRPVLVTLHLPLAWYPERALNSRRADTWLLPVSQAQADSANAKVRLLPPIRNGVEMRARLDVKKRRFAFMLGRICPEKGFHEALVAAKRADVPLLLAGVVFPWAEHERYFETEIRTRLDAQRRWIGRVTGARKHRLIAAASCLLVPSLANETSSLVAMESLAAGTPVIAYNRGALPEIVEHGVTGYIVRDAVEMADAIRAIDRISSEACRRAARERFSLERSMAGYLQLYAKLSGSARSVAASQDRHRLRAGLDGQMGEPALP